MRLCLGEQRTLIVIALIATFLRLGYVLVVGATHGFGEILTLLPDSQRYTSVMRDWLGGAPAAAELAYSGPGYPAFLYVTAGENSALGALVIQCILAGLTVFGLGRLASRITGQERVAVGAALICCLSPTGVTLSAAILTEVLFVFLLVAALLLVVDAIQNDAPIWSALLCGGCLGWATLTRSVGFFVPGVIAAVVVWQGLRAQRRDLYRWALICVVTSSAFPAAWMMRNRVVHGVGTVATVGVHTGADYLAAQVIARDKRSKISEVRKSLASQYEPSSTVADAYEQKKKVLVHVARTHPTRFFKTYSMNIVSNLTAADELHALQLQLGQPSFWFGFRALSILIQLVAVAGAVVLFLRGRHWETALLALLYAGFAGASGISFWQSSRLTYPTQIAWSIWVAVAVLGLRPLKAWLRRRLALSG